MIVVTAGHVDHGKTTLIRALTGIETDSLAEEQRRGMSIDLGFAHAAWEGGRALGFVDVPGHERFVRNMLAGVASADHALLVVAADDGPMPQTLEHLAVLDLLGFTQACVALTKADRVTPRRIAEVEGAVEAMLATTGLRGSPVFPVDGLTGSGVAALREHLASASRAWRPPAARGEFRLAVDRSFHLAGAGLVVTGSVQAGSVLVGDTLKATPSGEAYRVRGIQVHDLPVDHVAQGERCALNLAGAGRRGEEPGRGDWLVAPSRHAPTDRIDVRLRVMAERPRNGASLQLHLGTAATGARLVWLDDERAQLLLDRPIGTLHGDRLILRDAAARHVVAGGSVVDPFAPVRGRARPERLAWLHAFDRPDAAEALGMLLDLEPQGVDLDLFALARNLSRQEVAGLPGRVGMEIAGDRAIAPRHWQALCDAIVQALADWHAEHPDEAGPGEALLAATLPGRVRHAAYRAALQALADGGRVQRRGLCLHLPTHRPVLGEGDVALLARIELLLRAAGLRPPSVGDLARDLGMELLSLKEALLRCTRLGHLVQVAPNRWFMPSTVGALKELITSLAAESEDGFFDAASFRDRSGIGRNLSIEVLEFFDRMGVTRRKGSARGLL